MIDLNWTTIIERGPIHLDARVEAIYVPATEGYGSEIQVQGVYLSDEDLAAVGSLYPALIKWVEKEFRDQFDKEGWGQVEKLGLKKYDWVPNVSAGFSKAGCGYRY
jgi:hypothetical protein